MHASVQDLFQKLLDWLYPSLRMFAVTNNLLNFNFKEGYGFFSDRFFSQRLVALKKTEHYTKCGKLVSEYFFVTRNVFFS